MYWLSTGCRLDKMLINIDNISIDHPHTHTSLLASLLILCLKNKEPLNEAAKMNESNKVVA